MKLLRSILGFILFLIFGLGGIILGLFIFPLISILSPAKYRRLYLVNTVHYTWKIFIFLMRAFTIIKLDYSQLKDIIKTTKGTLIVANHPSLIDVVILVSLFPKSICLVKSNINSNFFMRFVVNRVYLYNNLPAEELIKKTTRLLNDGYNFILFPEGTRTTEENPKLQRGVAHIHFSTNAPILPINIATSSKILGKNQNGLNLGSTPCKYTLNLKPIINIPLDEKLSNHKNAIKLLSIVNDSIFNKIN